MVRGNLFCFGPTGALWAWDLNCHVRLQPIKPTERCCCVQGNLGKRRRGGEGCGGGDESLEVTAKVHETGFLCWSLRGEKKETGVSFVVGGQIGQNFKSCDFTGNGDERISFLLLVASL